MQELVKLSFLAIVGVLLAIQFKGHHAEYGIYIGLAMGIYLFGYAIRQAVLLGRVFEQIKDMLGGAQSYLGILLKVIGITYICEFCSSICKDAGYQAVAGQIEVVGKMSVMVAGIPLLFAVIEQIEGFM